MLLHMSKYATHFLYYLGLVLVFIMILMVSLWFMFSTKFSTPTFALVSDLGVSVVPVIRTGDGQNYMWGSVLPFIQRRGSPSCYIVTW